MTTIERHTIGLNMAYDIAAASKDPKQQVGAVLFNARGEQVMSGYNGFAPSFPDLAELWNDDIKHLLVIHAEMNLLLRARHEDCDGGTIYVSKVCCLPCRVACEARRIRQIVTHADEYPEAVHKTWWKAQHMAIELFMKHAELQEVKFSHAKVHRRSLC